MDPQTFSYMGDFMRQAPLPPFAPPPPPPPLPPSTPEPSSSICLSPVSSTTANYGDEDPDLPAVKQTWEEFCREQECNRILNSSTPYRPPSALSTDSYRSSTSQVSSARSPSSSRWQSRNSKRSRNPDVLDREPVLKTSKKRKKPLSQNVPAKKEWSLEDAERALAIERECNKRSKTALIIKFPDLELNRDIVAGFHPQIENVHFQQPSTPRFCFITLKDPGKVEEVIADLNKYKFGEKCLLVEHKKDKEDDQAVSAKDLDPFTLYVGNLAQEITKEDMVQLYPNSRRIDIGYAKKMKYTRYAFVVFHTIYDAIESFKRTHNHQIYNKSLIVRFRRLHGTVGMPGDNKQQNTPKQSEMAEKQISPRSPAVDLELPDDASVTSTFCNGVARYPASIKQELHGIDFDEDDDYINVDALSDPIGHIRSKPVKFEVKNEMKPEVYEYIRDHKFGIKTELKLERKIKEPDLSDYFDEDEIESECGAQDVDEFEEMCLDLLERRKRAANSESSFP